MTKGYLRAWETKRELLVYDRLLQRSFPSQAKSVANENGFYSPELEKALAEELDDPAVVVLRRFSDGQPLSADDRELVARFLFVQWKRTPVAKQRIMSKMPAVESKLEREWKERLELAAVADPDVADRAAELSGRIDDMFRNRTDAQRTELWHQLVMLTTGPQVHDAIQSMNWVLVRAPNRMLLTCDNPIYFHEHEGLARENGELTFPLSPSTALWATREPIQNGAILRESASMARELNRRTALRSDRWIFYAHDQPWVESFIKKGSWSINRLRR